MSSAGDILAAKFQVLEQLGSKSILLSLYRSTVNLTTSLSPGGSFGTVYKAIEKQSGTIVAIKQVSYLFIFLLYRSSDMSLRLDRPRV